ncbi:acyltransferase family protein [Macrococcus equipercicus]|nr:acyltransferase family protein [Macrococcus equipercicus]
MNIKTPKTELNYLRIIFCLIIITTHILTEYTLNYQPDDKQIKVIYWIRMAIIFGTPGFIMLSQLLVTMNYKAALPKNYLSSRFSFIVVPYLIIGLFYSLSESQANGHTYWHEFMFAVVSGNWHGYFVIVIVQFFLLNLIVYKYFPGLLGSKLAVVAAFAVNTAYLFAHNTIEPFRQFMAAYYPLSPDTFILGWISYYFIGSYIGLNYERFLTFVKEHTTVVIIMAIASYMLFIVIKQHDYWDVSSFNYATILFTACMFLLMLRVSTTMTSFMPKTAAQISAYSFFIYLFHPLILDAVYNYTSRFQEHTILFISTSIIIVLGCCIGVGTLLRDFPIFKYVIGKQPYKL